MESEDEEKLAQSARTRKAIFISGAATIGTFLFALFVWYAIFSNQFATFREDTYHIRIKYPKNWVVRKDYEGTVVAFISPKENSLDMFPENLNITVTDLTSNPMTLDQYSQLAIKQMNAVFKDKIEVVESTPSTFVGLPAYVYVVKGKSSEELILKFVLFIKDNKAYYITCAAQLFEYDKYVAKFDEMLRSFSIPTL